MKREVEKLSIIPLIIIKLVVGTMALWVSFVLFTRSGKGNGFQYYAIAISILNIIIFLNR
ncbi:hypothetical protein D3Z51_09055 [Clostridiaceae bacterium]|nr:hypothetical protein [Clostridiaceae bacterium]RKI14405.1 hypothetical protein D7V81_08540 [bacterium 1XD21-70]